MLFLYGGEHVARTPVDSEQTAWSLSLFDLQWRKLPDGPSPRVAHSQAVSNDGLSVFVFGGRAGISMSEAPLNDLWRFDLERDKWTECVSVQGDPPSPRSFHKMVCVGSSLFVFGGCSAEGRLADLHRYDIDGNTWHPLGPSPLLRGRGGASLIAFNEGKAVAVVAGFAGEETADGHIYDLLLDKWEDQLLDYTKEDNSMRPRSVCVSSLLPPLSPAPTLTTPTTATTTTGKSSSIAVLFGGEVDPSDRGHEGAGGFTNDLVFLDAQTGKVLQTTTAPNLSSSDTWPESRGWAAGDALLSPTNECKLFIFGGLTGDDLAPRRLDDLWECTFTQH